MPSWKIKEAGLEKRSSIFGFHPVVEALLRQRGLATKEAMDAFLFPEYARDTHDPFLFRQMEKAVERIGQARLSKEKIVIFGDYDADGITSAAILKETLENLGCACEVYIPDKDKEGYGMNETAVRKFIAQGIKLIITVDCGIANFDEVTLANEHGLEVIIVDHHHVPQRIPGALAIVNQRMADETYPFRELAGVGTAFKLVQALYRTFIPEKEEQAKWHLDLVAIGTIADCVPLVGENRIFAKYGLMVLGKTRIVGLRELFQVGRIAIDENSLPDSEKVSFQIAPRLNAAGRMDHANLALDLVMEKQQVKARELALEIEAKNQERQKVTAAVFEEVKKVAEQDFADKKFIFASSAHFPSGILGLVAGKIAERFNKPTAVFQEKGDIFKGSFRSVPALNIVETIEECAEWAEKFGGHSQAAGVVVAQEKFEQFCSRIGERIEEKLSGKDLQPVTSIDMEIGPADVDFELAEGLEKMEPFGEGNRRPVFLMRGMKVDEARLVGNGSKHLKLLLRSQDGPPKIFDAIGFGIGAENEGLLPGDIVNLVFGLEIDEWNGNKKIQLKIVDLEKVGSPSTLS